MIKIIDPHLHLFNLNQGDYHWLNKDNPPFWPDKSTIQQSFTEKDLALNLPLSLAGFVHVEAGFDNQQPERELDYLAQSCHLPFVAIASIDLTLDSLPFTQQLCRLLRRDTFCGVRHILTDQASVLLNCPQVLKNIRQLNNYTELDLTTTNTPNLIVEIQLPLEDNLAVKALCHVVQNNQNISFIINHGGFPTKETLASVRDNWQENLIQLSQLSNIAIKCSGWEMIDRQYCQDINWLNHSLASCFDAFGKHRMMLASNFPLCLFTHTCYQDYWQFILATDFFKTKTLQEKNALCYHSALHYYHLNV